MLPKQIIVHQSNASDSTWLAIQLYVFNLNFLILQIKFSVLGKIKFENLQFKPGNFFNLKFALNFY